MALKTTSGSPALPASPTSSKDERHAELAWLEVSTIDEILDLSLPLANSALSQLSASTGRRAKWTIYLSSWTPGWLNSTTEHPTVRIRLRI
ncbi:hypothetical protein N657DRAFT_651713 [Parathielavia appendiculata]|uniref:Uncharacterized protein n=1 Tax=Parathielavia appendiculata TaxID=2587402 RepID=A0AAN6YZ32_9PEZI|nr:hypothetical protein N657DRAFT_651713 [Parathielavia appendiculata]